ncbi:MAG: type III restriction endonuclease subunit R, partial [Thermoplasmata archaeon]
LEVNFARFLDSVNDVKAFSKLVQKIGFFIEYRDSDGNLRYYYPDFIIRIEDKYVIAETKGEEDVDVKFKDKRARLWCEDAERVTGDKWIYIRVNEAEFYKYHFDSFEKMIQFFNSEDNEDTRLK